MDDNQPCKTFADLLHLHGIRRQQKKQNNSEAATPQNVVDQKFIQCQQTLHKGTNCQKDAFYSINYLNIDDEYKTLNMCKLHSKIITKYAGSLPNTYRQFKSELLPGKQLKQKRIKPKLVDLIDEKSDKPSQCCVHLQSLNKPLCSMSVLYKIKGKYFCEHHGKKHPFAGIAEVIKYRSVKGDKFRVIAEELHG